MQDGRLLAYAETGPASGTPVLYLHGAIGTPWRRSTDLDAAIAALGLRYLMVSRPGFGASDPLPGRTLLQHAGDIEQLADALGFDRFAVVGVSTGAPYALACAHALTHRVPSVAAVSSLSPFHVLDRGALQLRLRVALGLLARAPRTCAAAGDAVVRLLERHPRLLERAMVSGSTSDTAARSFLEAAHRGVGEMIGDYLVCRAPWGFDPRAIATDVQVWHGMRDQLAPVDHALALATAIPRSRLALDPDDGHFFFRRRVSEILEGVAAPFEPSSTML